MSDSEIDSDDLFVKIKPKKQKISVLNEPIKSTKIIITVKDSEKTYTKSVLDTDTLLNTFGNKKNIIYKNTKLSSLISFKDIGQINVSDIFLIEDSEGLEVVKSEENVDFEIIKLFLLNFDGKKSEVQLISNKKIKDLRNFVESNLIGFVLNGKILDEEDAVENILEDGDVLDLIYL